MKSFNNIELSINIVDNLARHGCFKDEAKENFAHKLTIDFLKNYEEAKLIEPKTTLKEKTLNAVDTAHKLVDNIFIGLKETLNKKDEDEKNISK
jgi:ribosomal protein L6P/L9E